MTNLSKLKKLFKNKKLLELALTHRSWVNENQDTRESNERLEFLGDAILEFVVSRDLYTEFPDKEEGYLTALRANIVNTVSLANIAKKLEIGDSLFLSKGEEEGGGRENPSLLANTIEALIGALYLDQGMKHVSEFISKNILSEVPNIVKRPLKDAKSRLQEIVQSKGLSTPKYEVISESGPDHAKQFTIGVVIDNKLCGEGTGKNKSEGAQLAAKKAIDNFT